MNVQNIIYIPTDKIKKISLLTNFDIKSPYQEDGGDWDVSNLMDFEDGIIYTSIRDMIVDKKEWQETSLYVYIVKKMQAGEPKWDCDTVEKCVQRGKYLLDLYDDIKNIGNIVSRDDLTKYKLKSKSSFGKNDCIQVAIGRNGQILFASNGSHRLSIAKILGIPTVPAMVCRRHVEWEKYRKKVTGICDKRWAGKTYQKMFHPDLQFVEEMHADNRYDILKTNTDLKNATLLDIGSLFGYICYRGEMDGFNCTAVELVSDFLNVMKKMKVGMDMKFNILSQDVFKMESINYDIVVAFNIFHHFIKTEELHTKLIELLGRIECKEMFVQFHKPHESQMKDSYKNYNPEEFAKFILSHLKNKSGYKYVGISNGREIYKIF
jgi:hypothetical protein